MRTSFWQYEDPPRCLYQGTSFSEAEDVTVNVNVLRWLMNEYPKCAIGEEYPLDGISFDSEKSELRWAEGGGKRLVQSERIAKADTAVPLIFGLLPYTHSGRTMFWGGQPVDGAHRIARAKLAGTDRLPSRSVIWVLAPLATSYSGIQFDRHELCRDAGPRIQAAFSAIVSTRLGHLSEIMIRASHPDLQKTMAAFGREARRYLDDFGEEFPALANVLK